MPFLNNPIIAVAPPEHPLCHAATLSLQDLTSYPLLTREPGSGTRRAAEDYLRQKRAHFTQTIRSPRWMRCVNAWWPAWDWRCCRAMRCIWSWPADCCVSCQCRNCRCNAAGAWFTRAVSA